MEEDYKYTIAILSQVDGVDVIAKKGAKGLRFPVYINERAENTDIAELDLSVRSSNCLKRANIHTVGDLMNSISGVEDLKKIRNCGMKSVREIMDHLFQYQYMVLTPERQKKFIDRVIELNQ